MNCDKSSLRTVQEVKVQCPTSKFHRFRRKLDKITKIDLLENEGTNNLSVEIS
jgi:hypothetical protein